MESDLDVGEDPDKMCERCMTEHALLTIKFCGRCDRQKLHFDQNGGWLSDHEV